MFRDVFGTSVPQRVFSYVLVAEGDQHPIDVDRLQVRCVWDQRSAARLNYVRIAVRERSPIYEAEREKPCQR